MKNKQTILWGLLFLAFALAGIFTLPKARAAAADVYGLLAEAGYAGGAENFVLEQELPVSYGTVYRFKQLYAGNEVYGRGVRLAVDREGRLLFSEDDRAPVRDLPRARLDEADAAAALAERLGSEKSLSAEPVVYVSEGGRAEPAFRILTAYGGGMSAVVSSVNGEILSLTPLRSPYAVSTTQRDALGQDISVTVERENGTYYLSDFGRKIYTYDCANGTVPYESRTSVFSDPVAVSAFANTVTAYDFYTHAENIGVSRRGIDGRNGTIVYLEIHYRDQTGLPYDNASFGYDLYENAGYMFVGDGGETLDSPGKALDIIAHEYQHGVTQFIADPEYLNEPAAVNEGLSDVFGILVEGGSPEEEDYWLVGENGTRNGAGLRSAKYPAKYGYRVNYGDRVPSCGRLHDHAECDYGGAHENATILSHVMYKLWERLPAFYTPQRLGTLFYSALCTLGSREGFREYAQDLLSAADALGYGEEEKEVLTSCLFSSGLLETENTHLVRFYDGDTLLEVCTVRHGDTAIPPADPVRAPDEAGEYVFSHWSRDLENVVSDLRVEAVFETHPRMFTVTFEDENGALLKTERVPYGGMASPPAVPQKAATERTDYDFVAWDRSFMGVKEDMTVRPLYRAVPCYFVLFTDGDRVLARVRVRQNEAATPPAPPERAPTERYEYVFTGWDIPLGNITRDVTAAAVFRTDPRMYSVQYFADGGLVRETKAAYGAAYDLTPPQDPGGKRFSGWYLDEALTQRADGGTVRGPSVLYAKLENAPSAALVIGLSAGGAVLLSAAGIGVFVWLRRKKSAAK